MGDYALARPHFAKSLLPQRALLRNDDGRRGTAMIVRG
jgi:hypothetical protein